MPLLETPNYALYHLTDVRYKIKLIKRNIGTAKDHTMKDNAKVRMYGVPVRNAYGITEKLVVAQNKTAASRQIDADSNVHVGAAKFLGWASVAASIDGTGNHEFQVNNGRQSFPVTCEHSSFHYLSENQAAAMNWVDDKRIEHNL